MKVQRLLTASRDCISAEAFFDTSEIVVGPNPPAPTYCGLRPKMALRDPAGLNPTPCAIFSEDLKAADPCVAP